MNYDYKGIEARWQKKWDDANAFAAKQDFSLPKYYALVEFPYPSGQGLHVGHPRPYTALDIVSRKKRMQGYNVLYPIGWVYFSARYLIRVLLGKRPMNLRDTYQKSGKRKEMYSKLKVFVPEE